MAFENILKLRDTTRIASQLYFFDTNAWIYAMQRFDDLEWWEKLYYNFFYDVIESELSPKPQIILTSLLLSEIVNTFLRQVAIPDYKLSTNIPGHQEVIFKSQYRPTQHYRDSFKKLMDDIYSLKNAILFVHDAEVTNEDILLPQDIGMFDYNDYLYYKLSQELNKNQKVTIITNDSDFQVEDIEVITANKTLLALNK